MISTVASLITKAASKQTYFTIRCLVDRERVDHAYRVYGFVRSLCAWGSYKYINGSSHIHQLNDENKNGDRYRRAYPSAWVPVARNRSRKLHAAVCLPERIQKCCF